MSDSMLFIEGDNERVQVTEVFSPGLKLIKTVRKYHNTNGNDPHTEFRWFDTSGQKYTDKCLVSFRYSSVFTDSEPTDNEKVSGYFRPWFYVGSRKLTHSFSDTAPPPSGATLSIDTYPYSFPSAAGSYMEYQIYDVPEQSPEHMVGMVIYDSSGNEIYSTENKYFKVNNYLNTSYHTASWNSSGVMVGGNGAVQRIIVNTGATHIRGVVPILPAVDLHWLGQDELLPGLTVDTYDDGIGWFRIQTSSVATKLVYQYAEIASPGLNGYSQLNGNFMVVRVHNDSNYISVF